MTHAPSIMRMHLGCRIWIAEMNFDLNVLRIFDDYLKELSNKKSETEIKIGIEHFEKEFVDIRKEIDELRHEMHLLKMKLGAYARENKILSDKNADTSIYTVIEKRYVNFRKAFSKNKNEFTAFEGKWLD
ncbi:MAG: hypothetical protein ABIN89_12535 [Chitinophagaceae bacterium]